MRNDLTVIIPAYNEAKTLGKVIEEVLITPRVAEVIVIDDGSKDSTVEVVSKYKKQIKFLRNDKNRGKGFSIRRGIQAATSKYLIVQDGDLELLPSSYELLFKKMEESGADMVNGKRDFSDSTVNLISKFASKMIPLAIFLLFGKKVNDVVCGYKLMKVKLYKELELKSDRFEIETEIIVKAIKKGYKIAEVEVPFKPRSKKEGKHVRWTDGIKVLKLLVKYRFGLIS